MKQRMKVGLTLTALLALIAGGISASPAHAAGAADDHTVLILGPTVTGGTSSLEATIAGELGLNVEVVDGPTWDAKSTADFATYKALVLGDPTCSDVSHIAAAVSNRTTWSPAVTGSGIVIGTDPVFHHGAGRATDTHTLLKDAMSFVTSEAGKTGLLAELSCYYAGSSAQPVPVLDQFGSFTTEGTGCGTTVHIVASSPAIAGSTDASLTGWGCSTHESFSLWPPDWNVLAIAEEGAFYTATDGTRGTPYILVRGSSVTVISDIKLTPADATNPVGASHTVTATVTTGSPPTAVVGTTVTFNVISGPNVGATGTGVTNGSGQATFTYSDTGGAGKDFIQATFVDSASHTQTSNNATKEWVNAPTTTAVLTLNTSGDAEADLTAVDSVGGGGVKQITTILDGGSPTVTPGSTAIVTTSASGPHTLQFWAQNNAGGTEATNTLTFYLVKTNQTTGQVLGALMTRNGGSLQAQLRLFNDTASTLHSVKITSGSLKVGATANPTSSSLPNLGDIAAGTSATTILLFPGAAGSPGTFGFLSVKWISTDGGKAAASYGVKLP